MVLKQAKWYYYVILGLVDVEANFLGKCFMLLDEDYDLIYKKNIAEMNIFMYSNEASDMLN